MSEDEQDSNLLLVPGIMNAPRTPGAESCAKGRNRKCSIVAEEEDDDEEPEPSSPLNRRGSRSEGRINITVQDRLSAEVAERLKKEKLESEMNSKPKIGLIDGIAGIKIIRSDNSKEKFLGQAGTGNRKDIRSSSVDKSRPLPSRGQSDVKFLTESSTISIPAINISSSSSNPIPKPYKTMPSPSRPNVVANSANTCLKEIFEECDAGSSDNNSNTNTPRAILRSQANATHHRRTKFHKSRTTSGSSTDGSDDDNAEKKRATKIIDSTIAKQFTQRRDSHDDSSDSQDPGTACSGNSNAGSSLILRNGSNSNNKSSSQTGDGNHQDDRGKTTSNSSEIGYRKHRTGRRRQTETRLRESQSLNRITEVQECENSSAQHSEKPEKSKDFEDEFKSNRVAALNQLNSKNSDTIVNATNDLKANKNHNNSKAKGFSARFLQNFKRSHDVTSGSKNHQKSKNNLQNLRPPAQLQNDGNDRSKKIKILGRYFQVHKKICQPLSGLFRTSGSARLSSNLYKAQSCSSIIRDGIHHPNSINNNTLSTSSSSMNKNAIKFDEKLINEREFLIKNCLSSRFIGSDGDININDAVTEKAVDKQLLDYIDDDILSGTKC